MAMRFDSAVYCGLFMSEQSCNAPQKNLFFTKAEFRENYSVTLHFAVWRQIFINYFFIKKFAQQGISA